MCCPPGGIKNVSTHFGLIHCKQFCCAIYRRAGGAYGEFPGGSHTLDTYAHTPSHGGIGDRERGGHDVLIRMA